MPFVQTHREQNWLKKSGGGPFSRAPAVSRRGLSWLTLPGMKSSGAARQAIPAFPLENGNAG